MGQKVNKNILIIERDHDIRVSLRKQLEDAGHFVISVTTNAEALDILSKITAPNLILLSHQSHEALSPQIFLSTIRQKDQWKDIPVSQISNGSGERIMGTCCSCDPWNMLPILSWLDNSVPDKSWQMA